MSSLIVKVRKFTRLPHPNADSLFVAIPDGTNWNCCVRTDQFENDDLGIYIPVDSLLPSQMASDLNLPNVKEGEPYRIRTIRLRSRLSQGLLLPNNGRFKEGEDVAEILGITKYVEPEPTEEDLRISPEDFRKYTDIENIMNFPNVFIDGEEVVMTEKIHGKTFRCGWVDDEFYFGSARVAFKSNAKNKWFDVAVKYDLENLMQSHKDLIIHGELFGAGVQSLRYGLDNAWDLRVFDIFVRSEDRYMDFDELVDFCEKLNLPMVPLLYRGPYSTEKLNEWTTGKSATALRLGAQHVTEGVVVKPAKERWDFDNGLGRAILKSINPDYLLKNLD